LCLSTTPSPPPIAPLFPYTTLFRSFEGMAASAGENLYAHLALLNALDLRLRGAEIVVAGEDERANELLAAARKLAFFDRVVLRADRKSTRLNSSHDQISYAVFCLKK